MDVRSWSGLTRWESAVRQSWRDSGHCPSSTQLPSTLARWPSSNSGRSPQIHCDQTISTEAAAEACSFERKLGKGPTKHLISSGSEVPYRYPPFPCLSSSPVDDSPLKMRMNRSRHLPKNSLFFFPFFFSCIAERARSIVGQLLEIRNEMKPNWMQNFHKNTQEKTNNPTPNTTQTNKTNKTNKQTNKQTNNKPTTSCENSQNDVRQRYLPKNSLAHMRLGLRELSLARSTMLSSVAYLIATSTVFLSITLTQPTFPISSHLSLSENSLAKLGLTLPAPGGSFGRTTPSSPHSLPLVSATPTVTTLQSWKTSRNTFKMSSLKSLTPIGISSSFTKPCLLQSFIAPKPSVGSSPITSIGFFRPKTSHALPPPLNLPIKWPKASPHPSVTPILKRTVATGSPILSTLNVNLLFPI